MCCSPGAILCQSLAKGISVKAKKNQCASTITTAARSANPSRSADDRSTRGRNAARGSIPAGAALGQDQPSSPPLAESTAPSNACAICWHAGRRIPRSSIFVAKGECAAGGGGTLRRRTQELTMNEVGPMGGRRNEKGPPPGSRRDSSSPASESCRGRCAGLMRASHLHSRSP